jgi:hypothetical protein
MCLEVVEIFRILRFFDQFFFFTIKVLIVRESDDVTTVDSYA